MRPWINSVPSTTENAVSTIRSRMLPQVQAVAEKAQVKVVASVALQPDGSNADEAWKQVAKAEPQAILLLAAGAAVLGFMG